MNPYLRFRFATTLAVCLLLFILNVHSMGDDLQNDLLNKNMELEITGTQNESVVDMQVVQSPKFLKILNRTIGTKILLYLEPEEVRRAHKICQAFYKIVHSDNFAVALAQIREHEFHRIRMFFEKFNSQDFNRSDELNACEATLTLLGNGNQRFFDFTELDLEELNPKTFHFPFHFRFKGGFSDFEVKFTPSTLIRTQKRNEAFERTKFVPFNEKLSLQMYSNQTLNVSYKIHENIRKTLEEYSKTRRAEKYATFRLSSYSVFLLLNWFFLGFWQTQLLKGYLVNHPVNGEKAEESSIVDVIVFDCYCLFLFIVTVINICFWAARVIHSN